MSLSTVTTMGYMVGNINLVVTLGYGQGGVVTPPPPPPVTVTVPTGAGGWWDFELPCEREARRKAREHLDRIAFGILPPDPEPIALPKQVQRYIEKKVQQLVPRKKEISVAAQDKIIEFVVRETLKIYYKEELEKRRLRQEEEEEEEVGFMFFLH